MVVLVVPVALDPGQVVAAGETTLDDEGRFHLDFTPSADERLAKQGVTYRYRLGVDVTDEGGETRSAERVFRLGFVSVEARIVADLGFLTARHAAAVRVLRTDLDGVPRAGSGEWRLVQLEQPEETLTPADQPRPSPPEGREAYQTPGDSLRPAGTRATTRRRSLQHGLRNEKSPPARSPMARTARPRSSCPVWRPGPTDCLHDRR